MSGYVSIEPIDDDEFLYRRVPESQGWYASDDSLPLSYLAFRPGKRDKTGLSICREKHKTLEEAARGRPNKSYYVAVLRAGDLRTAGISVVARPLENDPGHAEIEDLTYENRKTDQARGRQKLLAECLTLCVKGPFSC